MTRFARARGSKASNEKLPEKATPWSVMKQHLIKRNEEIANKSKKAQADSVKLSNYRKFLSERAMEESNKTKWAEFPGVKKISSKTKVGNSKVKRKMILGLKTGGGIKGTKKGGKINGKIKKARKKILQKEQEPSQDPLTDSDDSNEVVNDEFKNLKAKLDTVLDEMECDKDNSNNEETGGDISEASENAENSEGEDDEDMSQSDKESCKDGDEGEELQDVGEDSEGEQNSECVVDDLEEDQESDSDNENACKDQEMFVEDGGDAIKIGAADSSDDDEAPQEVSSKIEQPEIQIKKVKQKKKLLMVSMSKALHDNSKKNVDNKAVTNKKNEVNIKKGPAVKKTPIDLSKLDEKSRAKIERSRRKKLKRKENIKLKKAQQKENAVENKNISGDFLKKSNEDLQSDQTSVKKMPKEGKKLDGRPQRKDDQQKKASNKKNNKEKKEKAEKKVRPKSWRINGVEVEIEFVDGFPVRKEDAERLKQLRRQMIAKGLPRSEIGQAIKLERRRAEKVLARLKRRVCFNCRKAGHNLSDCPEVGKAQVTESIASGICFKCGSTEHTHFQCKVVHTDQFKYAACFICKEQGHISRQCPDNPKGLYPKGGACKVCGEVTHLKKDCPTYQAQQQQEQDVKVGTIQDGNPDDLGEGSSNVKAPDRMDFGKVVKF